MFKLTFVSASESLLICVKMIVHLISLLHVYVPILWYLLLSKQIKTRIKNKQDIDWRKLMNVISYMDDLQNRGLV